MSALAVADLGIGPVVERGREESLDDVLRGAWEALDARRSTSCPVCDGELAPIWDRHQHALIGSCRDCGAQLS